MKLTSYSLAPMIVLLIFGGISFSSAMNWWETESTKVPATYTEGELAGQYDPADIRGSYTFGEVSQLFEIPLTDLQSSFRIPAEADPASYPLKSLEAQFADLPVEMGTGSVRMFVAFYKGLPFELNVDEDTYLFREAADTLFAHGHMTTEQIAYLEDHIALQTTIEEAPVQETPASTGDLQVEPTPAPTEHAAPDKTVSGKTTFRELLDWGVSQETIEQILGEGMPALQTGIKDFLSLKGVEFSSIKTALQTEVDKTK